MDPQLNYLAGCNGLPHPPRNYLLFYSLVKKKSRSRRLLIIRQISGIYHYFCIDRDLYVNGNQLYIPREIHLVRVGC